MAYYVIMMMPDERNLREIKIYLAYEVAYYVIMRMSDERNLRDIKIYLAYDVIMMMPDDRNQNIPENLAPLVSDGAFAAGSLTFCCRKA